MLRLRPNLRWHLDTAQHPAPAEVTAQFAEVDDYNLGHLIDHPALTTSLVNALPGLQTHAQDLIEQHWTKQIPLDEPVYDLDVLIRTVNADWSDRLPETHGIHGQFAGFPTPKIMLLCATPDTECLAARFIHEFGHYLDLMHQPQMAGMRMSHWLRSEVAAEQLVVARVGAAALTHGRTCTPPARAVIRQLIVNEGNTDDIAAEDAVLDYLYLTDSGQRARVLEAYALANEIVRRNWGAFDELVATDDQTFRHQLLNSPDLWAPSAGLEQA